MYVQPLFRNREEAGGRLGDTLARIMPDTDPLLLALPRGGVPVAFQTSRILNAELDVFLVRKLGVPGHEELAMGAIASGGVRVLNETLIARLGIPPAFVERVIERESNEIARRERLYRGNRPPPRILGRTVILVDDGLATGATMTAAARAVQQQDPKRVIAAVPLGSEDAVDDLRQQVDEVVCLETPEPFYAVGLWYEDFSPTTDDEVRELLDRAVQEHAA